MAIDLKAKVRAIPDFPEPGVLFRDLTPLLADADALALAVAELARPFADAAIDAVAGIDARGFIFGALAARELSCAFVPVRKAGKLPGETYSQSYALEYGTATLEVHADAFASEGSPQPGSARGHPSHEGSPQPGSARGHPSQERSRVLVVDDLIATGGTAAATSALVKRAGGVVVACAFVVELTGLGGRAALGGDAVHALMAF